MIFKKAMKVAVIFATLLVVNVQAKTFKYEVQDARVSQGHLYYLPFNLDNINSLVLTVNIAHPEADSGSVSLEVDFANAPKLVIKNFKLHDPHWGELLGTFEGL
ncbi:hypothetical protein P3339_09465 [Microbulbifer sp. MLAF003]|uniref:hypothetical protein n=1 Tax=Microbulbifer sp. MLAF003 TaxID=3032582 RepID=UPI0024AE1E03|nr:hypothetical protein [Microbulbifer sp. MLAF003]WHI52969.1 hypothetical protein P3339_09465 [Microbulbifer sp. MLAF003]